jgi:y4mF family transcriptional regulator
MKDKFRSIMAQNMKKDYISTFVKRRRKSLDLTQEQLAKKAGVGLRLVRDLEQGKNTLRLDKVNQVLRLFGYVAGPVKVSNPGRTGAQEEVQDA